MRYNFYTADVFTDRTFGGNQLAVFPNAAGLSDEQMKQITREFNYSECTFVFPADDPAHHCRVRIFTPGRELPFAGHPTVGTAFVLAAIGAVELTGDVTNIVFEEGVGPIPVSIDAVEGKPVRSELSAGMMPEIDPHLPTMAELAAALGLEVGDLRNDLFAPEIVSCGVPLVYVPLHDMAALQRIKVDTELALDLANRYAASELYAFVYDEAERHVYARMFAPAMGIAEDPATGAAATALAGYLGMRETQATGRLNWTVTQGVEMGRPSRLDVEADKQDGAMVAIRVGGASVMVMEGVIDLPDP
ncbi:MAG: PhzF family phenazine biosynthesis protein [Candidatus Promineifilaceae bacterium]